MAADQHPDVARLVGARRSRAAEIVSALSEPVLLVPVLLVVVAVRAAGVWPGVGWAVLAAVFCVGVPYAVLLVLVRRGTVSDRHIVVRDQRPVPLLAAVASVVVGVGVLRSLGAPAPVTALLVAMLAGLAVTALVSLAYKTSVHVGVVSGTAVVVAVGLGTTWGLLVLLAVPVVAWARVRAGRHTVGQALVGCLIGTASAGLVYPPLAG